MVVKIRFPSIYSFRCFMDNFETRGSISHHCLCRLSLLQDFIEVKHCDLFIIRHIIYLDPDNTIKLVEYRFAFSTNCIKRNTRLSNCKLISDKVDLCLDILYEDGNVRNMHKFAIGSNVTIVAYHLYAQVISRGPMALCIVTFCLQPINNLLSLMCLNGKDIVFPARRPTVGVYRFMCLFASTRFLNVIGIDQPFNEISI